VKIPTPHRRTVLFVPPVPQHLTDEEVLAAIRDIPEAYQEVILLSDVEELTYKEIAVRAADPARHGHVALHRGRALLRQHLASTTAVRNTERE
jgi:DNA-directed RNA polymerase specialized sigma24 family protein